MLFSSEHMIQITDDLRIESYDFVFNIAVISENEFSSRVRLKGEGARSIAIVMKSMILGLPRYDGFMNL